MLVEPKVLNPLSISLNTFEKKFVLLGEHSEIPDYDLKVGCIIGTNNYGFKIISPEGETLYNTQCRITAMEVKNGLLTIHEEGKYMPWKFSLDGNCISSANFLDIYPRDVRYLTDDLGIHSALLNRVNEESYLIVSDNIYIDDCKNWYSVEDDTLIVNSKVIKINRRMFNENFKNNKTIRTIIIENGVQTIDAGAFSDFLSLTTLYIPKSLKNMALYIADEKILSGLRVFYKEKELPIRYNNLSHNYKEKAQSAIKVIDRLYKDFEIEDDVMHIKEISRETVNAFSILDFGRISTVIFDTEFVFNSKDKDLLVDYNEALHNWIIKLKKVVFTNSCAIIIPSYLEYEYDGKSLEIDCEVYPDLAKLITKEITKLFGIEDEDIFSSVLDLLGKYKIYLPDEEKCSKLFMLGFIDVLKAIKQYGGFNDAIPYLPKPIIEGIIKILCGDEALIKDKNFIGGIIDFTEYRNYLTFQKVFGIERNEMLERCAFTNTKIITPPLALFSPVSFFRNSFNNVEFENIIPSSWQPMNFENQEFKVAKSLGSGMTFKNELYLRFGCECNAICKTCWNKTLPPEKFDFDSIVKALNSLSPYLDDIFIGGGEPTLKNEYLLKLRRMFNDINTTVISNGSATPDIYKMLWNKGFNIGISRYSTSDDTNKDLFGTRALSNNDLSALIEEQRQRRLTIFATCIPGHLYSTESILEFINTFHKLGCNIVFQSPMLDKTLGDSGKIYDLDDNPCRQIFTEVGRILSESKFSGSVPIIGTAGYNLVIFEKFRSGIISFKEYITDKQYNEAWLHAVKRTFDFSITSEGNIYENWNNGGQQLVLCPKSDKTAIKSK